ncbi:MAG: hypothetical protein K0S32_2448 [Bacteroidetes bacterium]|nr:hypothetical protein [Bacteroidota bacterium]
MKKRFLSLIVSIPFFVNAQFAPAAGQPGTTAIKKDSSIIINWATGCKVIRGYQDVSNQSAGYANVGDSSKAIGVADGVNVVSLGDAGSAILTFQSPIKNSPGPDFCVFENSFDAGFLELAFVEVSSDGTNFTRFPATCNVQNTVQIGPFDTSSDPTKIDNLAGKYIMNYGVPFDLQQLNGTSGLDINAITHVKIIDAVGCIQAQYATYDKNSNKINDPWATAFGSSGFDLDAVGVINQVPVSVTENSDLEKKVRLFPNVTSGNVNVFVAGEEDLKVEVTDVSGKQILDGVMVKRNGMLSLSEVESGIYFVKLSTEKSSVTKKIIKTD